MADSSARRIESIKPERVFTKLSKEEKETFSFSIRFLFLRNSFAALFLSGFSLERETYGLPSFLENTGRKKNTG